MRRDAPRPRRRTSCSGSSPRTRRRSRRRWPNSSRPSRRHRPSPIAGPKLLDWERGEFIRSLGESLTTQGATVALVSDELDQGQRDVLSDVLAVAAGGMLVRHTVWDALGGFDPGLPVVDDALDFCVRARLAGHRVVRRARSAGRDGR